MTRNHPKNQPSSLILTSPDWEDYELLDSGKGRRLERFGKFTVVRPEHQAVWRQALPQAEWDRAAAVFEPEPKESGGAWRYHQDLPDRWIMAYKGLKFEARARGSRQVGVFPEGAALWDWFGELIRGRLDREPDQPLRVLNLFAYTGLASLAAAEAGAQVTHVDASRAAVGTARRNQALCGLEAAPIRWLVDDIVKFVRREVRRGSQYEGILLDPPIFGRGPKGQVWEFFESLPALLADCREILSPEPLFVALTAYGVDTTEESLAYILGENLRGLGGELEAGQLALLERSAGRRLYTSIFARWEQR